MKNISRLLRASKRKAMPLDDIDLNRRRCSIDLPSDGVTFVLHTYDEYTCDEKRFHSVHKLLPLLEENVENASKRKEKCYWLEVVNSSAADLPIDARILCEYFRIHPLTIEDIATLAPYTKLDLFHETGSLYLLTKILAWNGQRVHQQQISFYLRCSQNLLITFQEKSLGNSSLFFETIRNRLRKQSPHLDEYERYSQHSRLRQLNVDYLFYCLLDHIIDQHMFVMEEIANCIGQLDANLMASKQPRSLTTLHSIYRLKHDLLHLRIVFNPLKEIICRLGRSTSDDTLVPFRRTDPSLRLGLKHKIIRRQTKSNRRTTSGSQDNLPLTSVYLNEYIYVYLNDLNHHVDQLIDSLEIQRESIAILMSFWITLDSNETQEILNFLMLLTVLFMPCTLLTGMNSTNFQVQPQYQYFYSHYITLSVLALIFIGMVGWYKMKRWF